MKATVIYSKASVERRPQYRQQTLILREGERRWVRKLAVGDQAAEHLKKYGINRDRLNASLRPGHTVNMIECRENADGSVDFPFLTTPTLADRLSGMGPEDYLRTARSFGDALLASFETLPFEATDAFRAFFGVAPDVAGEPALAVANADLNFDNVFCGADGDYTIIDYEWVLDFPIPISFLMYRSLMLDAAYNAFDDGAKRLVLRGLGIREDLEAPYHEMELAFLASISPEEYKLDYFARVPGARQNVVYGFDWLQALPEQNRALDEALRGEVARATALSDELAGEQARAVRLSGQLAEEQAQSRQLAEDLNRERTEAVRLSGELRRELDTSVRLSRELAEEQANSVRLSGELAGHLAMYNEYASKWWFRGFRKLGHIRYESRQRLKRAVRKCPPLWALWRALAYLRHNGPAAFVRRLAGKKVPTAEEQRLIQQLAEQAAQPEEREAPIPETVRFSVVVPLYNTPVEFLREMIQSVQDQTYGNWELCLADGSDDAHGEVGEVCRSLAERDGRILYRRLEHNGGISENTNACIDMAGGDYIALFDHDDLLHPSALYETAKAIYEQGADFIYSDEVVFASPDRNNLIATHFKPDFSPDSMLSNNYICHLSVFKRSLLERSGGFRKAFDGSQDHDIILRLTNCAQKVAHIPKVLYYWRSHPTSVASDISTKTYAIDAGRNAVKDFLSAQRHMDAVVESTPEYPTMYHVKFPIEGEPSVDVVLDWCGRDLAELPARLERLGESAGWARLGFIVLADRDAPGDALSALKRPVRWLVTGEKNRAARLNEAAAAGSGDCLAFLDPGLESAGDGWAAEMLMLARQDHVGAVGGKIYFRDRTLRQGGLILRLGPNRLVGRSHFGVSEGNGGYFGQLAIMGDVSAVSCECMMLRRDRFEQAGGFDTGYRDVLFDVDLCMKLNGKGLRNLYTPFALFRGGDSADYSIDYGAGSEAYAMDAAAFRARWSRALSESDPCYNPNLTLDFSDYRVNL